MCEGSRWLLLKEKGKGQGAEGKGKHSFIDSTSIY